MAIMKTKIEDCKTEGECTIYTFFKNYLPDSFIVWSNIELVVSCGKSPASTEIDCILFQKDVGLNILSIKDWRINQVSKISGREITVNRKVQNNPYLNVKKQLYTLMKKLEQYNELKSFDGRIMAPINISLAFPFIEYNEWEKKRDKLFIKPDEAIPEGLTLFSNMFSKNSLLKDKHRAISFFQNIRDKKFKCGFEDVHIDVLDRVFGIDEVYQPPIEPPVEILQDDDYLIDLDNKQKALANKYLKNWQKKQGPIIIKGVAGSGKTVILLHIFSQIARDPKMKILYVGRQRELVEDFKRKLLEIGVVVESPCYRIDTFYQLFREFCPDYNKLKKDNKNTGYPAETEISNYIIEHLSFIKEEYDFVLIDEGHNLPDEWVKFLVYQCKGQEKGNVLYVEDFEQNIYKIKRDFKNTGLGVNNHENELLVSYRNTYEIAYFACQLTNKYQKIFNGKLDVLRKGAIPEVIFDKDYLKIAELISKKIEDWIEERFKPNEIAIIYPNLKRKKEGIKVKDTLMAAIVKTIYEKCQKQLSIHYHSHRIKSMFGPELSKMILSRRDSNEDLSNTINLVTSFSSQGISYKCVVAIMDNFEDPRWNKLKTNLAYITLTRATHNLLLIFSEECETYQKALEINRTMIKKDN